MKPTSALVLALVLGVTFLFLSWLLVAKISYRLSSQSLWRPIGGALFVTSAFATIILQAHLLTIFDPRNDDNFIYLVGFEGASAIVVIFVTALRNRKQALKDNVNEGH